MILATYLTRLFVVRVLGALFGFAALVEILDLFDMAGTILERGEGIAGLGRYALLRLPVIMVDVVPFAVLIGALFTFMAVASKSEVVAMRALGLAPQRIIMFLVPAALAVGALHVIASDMLAPPAETALRDWLLRSASAEAPSETAEYWIRSGPVLVGFASAAPNGSQLDHVLIYERDAGGQLARRIAAASAVYEGPLWLLSDVAVNETTADRRVSHDAMEIDLRMAPDDVLELSQPLEHLSFAQLWEGATGGPTGMRSQAFFSTRMMAMWALVATPAIMLVLAGPIAFGSTRSRTIGLQAAIALGLGLLFVLVAGILRTVGESGVVTPLLAVWAAPLGFAALAGLRMGRTGR